MSQAWEEGKRVHLRLSADAGGTYNSVADKEYFATGAYMSYELRVLDQFVRSASDRKLALDLGCGTGRVTLVLAEQFGQVRGYDFSAESISIAELQKLRSGAGNIHLEICDLETDFPSLPEGCASFVRAGFGMGSFFQHLEQLTAHLEKVLCPGGIALLSFYNKDALVYRADLSWKPALAARVLGGNTPLVEVNPGNGHTYPIPAQSYSAQFIEQHFSSRFELLHLTTYPTLCALFPKEVFARSENRQLLLAVDQLLAENSEVAGGPYILAVIKKREARQRLQHGPAIEVLRNHNIPFESREHAVVSTVDDVLEQLDLPVDTMVKSVVISVKSDLANDEIHHDEPRFYVVALQASRKVDFGKLARVLAIKRSNIQFATPAQVQQFTGFVVGSIPPFGLPPQVSMILDQAVLNSQDIWCGSGIPTISLRIAAEHLKALSTFTADVSRQQNTYMPPSA